MRVLQWFILVSKLFFCIIMLMGCVETFPSVKYEYPLSHRACKKYGDARACYSLAEQLAFQMERKRSKGQTKKELRKRIAFYLRRSCLLKRWESCAIFAVWLARMGAPCREIGSLLQKGCSHGLWYACALLVNPKVKRASYAVDRYGIFKESKCYFGEVGFKQKLRNVFCMFSQAQKKNPRYMVSYSFQCKKTYSESDAYSMMMGFFYWYNTSNGIFRHLINEYRIKNSSSKQ